jgi:phospholipid-binding lipoprotein MlaA
LLTEPIVFLNDLLQVRPVHALRTLARFTINATMGWGGTFDVAKRPYFKLPHEPNGFADTLGYYGIGPGPYLFLPFVGPTTLRDFLGDVADGAVMPFAVGHPFDRTKYQLPTGLIGGLDQRAEADQDLRTLFDTAVDPYATLRSVYLQDRAGEIAGLRDHRAQQTKDPLGDDLTDPQAKPDAKGAPQSEMPKSDAPELNDPLSDPAGTPATPAGSTPNGR